VVHHSSKRFFCQSCDKSYANKQSLNNHLVKEHKSLDKHINGQDISTCSIKSWLSIYEMYIDFYFININFLILIYSRK